MKFADLEKSWIFFQTGKVGVMLIATYFEILLFDSTKTWTLQTGNLRTYPNFTLKSQEDVMV